VNDLGIEAHWLWLLLATLLAVTELFVPGVYLVWFAAAAAATGVITLGTGIALPFQLVLFALLAIAAVYGGRHLYDRNPQPTSDPLLNDRAARLRGRTVTVVSAIVNGEGRVRVGDGEWTCRGPDCSEGTSVRVTGAEGNCLKVEPATALEGPRAP
jgi:hypothetical protein